MSLFEELNQIITQFNIRFTRQNTPAPFAKRYMRQLAVHVGKTTLVFQVDDEFEEVDHAGPALLFNMVLMECTWYAEEEDYLSWCASKNLEPGHELVRAYYMGLGKQVHALEKFVGRVNHTSFYEWQLNAGEAQELRKHSK